MSSLHCLRELIRDRLTAAAQEIFTAVESTIAVYQEELEDQRKLLDDQRKPHDQQQLQVKTPNLEQEETGSCDFKVKEEADVVAVKSEGNEEGAEFSQLHQRVTEDREDCGGPGLARTSGPDGHLGPGEQHQFEGVPEEVPPEQPERSIRVKQEEEEEADDITAVTVKREEDEVSPLSPPDQQQLQVKTPNLEQEETGSFKVKEEADVVAVKSEGNEEGAEFSQLHQRVTEDREDCGGPRLARTSGPDGHLGPGTEDETHSSETEDSDDWMTPLASTSLKTIKTDLTVDCKERGNTCDKISCSESSLKPVSTEIGQKPFDCPECGKKFKHQSSLWTHKKIHQGLKTLSCSECGKKFPCKYKLREHERTHTGEKPFSCSLCDKKFVRKSVLREHEVVHTGVKAFSCSHCGQRFAKKWTLRMHVITHTGEKPFRCSQCDKRFLRQTELSKHERTHTGEKPFSCSQCGKRFAQKRYLKDHGVLHTGEKPFSCSHCNKRFTFKNNLKKHETSHTKEKPFSCSVVKDLNESDLRTHERSHTEEKL